MNKSKHPKPPDSVDKRPDEHKDSLDKRQEALGGLKGNMKALTTSIAEQNESIKLLATKEDLEKGLKAVNANIHTCFGAISVLLAALVLFIAILALVLGVSR